MSKNLPIGTIVNMLAVSVGSVIGLLINQAFPTSFEAVIFQAIGLGVLVIGFQMGVKIERGNLLIFLFSLILGGLLGKLLGLDIWMAHLADTFKHALNVKGVGFSEGLITSFILFCVGSLTIVGAIEEGINGNRQLLFAKSLLDGISAIALTVTYGVGVWFSIIPMLIFQGGLTLLAARAKSLFTDGLVLHLTAVGGALIVAVGINMLKLGNINIENLLPSLLLVVILFQLTKKIKMPALKKE